MTVPKYFEDFDHLHVNTMPNRAYYIPASRRMEDLVENRERRTAFSAFRRLEIPLFYQCLRCKEEFFAEGYDTSAFETIPVRPSGRIMAMTTISIRTSATRSRWIRRMCRMRIRAVRT